MKTSCVRVALAALLAVALPFQAPPAAEAAHFGRDTNLYTQPTKFTCVPTSVKMQLSQLGIGGLTIYDSTPSSPPTDLYHEGLALKQCHKNVEGSGLDPRAWAWLLYNHTPAGYYYDHYKYSDPYVATRVMGEQLYYQQDVAGALVNAGHHAFVFVGYDASCDIGSPNCLKTHYTISNVYVNDPWGYNSNSPGADTNSSHCIGEDGLHYTCGLIGLGKNRLITYSLWTSAYFTQWLHQDCATWNNAWVIVRRKPNGVSGPPSGPVTAAIPLGPDATAKDPSLAPSDTGIVGTEYPEYSGMAAPVPAIITSPTAAPTDLVAALAQVRSGIAPKHNPAFRTALANAQVLSAVPVSSLDPGRRDYILVTVGTPGRATAVALFERGSRSGYSFGELALVQGGHDKPLMITASDASSVASKAGHKLNGTVRLVWRLTDLTENPFEPLYEVGTESGNVYVTRTGSVVASSTP